MFDSGVGTIVPVVVCGYGGCDGSMMVEVLMAWLESVGRGGRKWLSKRGVLLWSGQGQEPLGRWRLPLFPRDGCRKF
ncbi:proline-rich receptor-like protein kinase PERK9 [Iris pallida]|uniref:Proline-rich receptor-like protein kinase PERK9 n=1 Tax=Iris pallida TaxID=29817 RepID=A0AAX6FT35_IRIPA|nr:proline-rich receptor-like protein kinase PERK9 [Iris pallida]